MSLCRNRFILPFILPVATFAAAIFTGSLLLAWSGAAASAPIPYIDAFFIATSAVCVTGLASVDIATAFNAFGQWTILVLVQLGGLGITTYSTLILYLASHRISLTDKLAVGEALLNDPSFHLGKFLQRIVLVILTLEFTGAYLLHFLDPERIPAFPALFLSVSAFCNAGFALWSDSLVSWQHHAGVTSVVMLLIIFGGLGFAVLDESLRLAKARLARRLGRGKDALPLPRLSFHARLVWRTTAFLILAGTLLLILPEYFANDSAPTSVPELFLPSLFQSVAARTAGFNTVAVSRMADVSLLALILLMLVGGSPGSCAGGLKTTTFRILVAFAAAQLRGRSQITVNGKAIDPASCNKAFILLVFTLLAVSGAVFLLALTEGGSNPHGDTPFQLFDLLFEAVSAFATVGLTTDVTPRLSTAGKLIDCALMYIGRLGPIWLITTI
ncbi:MAG: potassium transporter TrkH, partial [Deltaproteobacteria bacterium]|nr:potassium transporter TrkH [Deltaproteobacteria bacterium]